MIAQTDRFLVRTVGNCGASALARECNSGSNERGGHSHGKYPTGRVPVEFCCFLNRGETRAYPRRLATITSGVYAAFGYTGFVLGKLGRETSTVSSARAYHGLWGSDSATTSPACGHGGMQNEQTLDPGRLPRRRCCCPSRVRHCCCDLRSASRISELYREHAPAMLVMHVSVFPSEH